MKAFSEISFKDAAQTYAIANTPLYLLRKLHRDPFVHEISASFSGSQIFG
jgi:hypothetical protein